MTNPRRWIMFTSNYVVSVAALGAAACIVSAIVNTPAALVGLIWAAALGVVGYGLRRRDERDRRVLLGVLWLNILTLLAAAGVSVAQLVRAGQSPGLTTFVPALVATVAVGVPLLILHNPSVRNEFYEDA